MWLTPPPPFHYHHHHYHHLPIPPGNTSLPPKIQNDNNNKKNHITKTTKKQQHCGQYDICFHYRFWQSTRYTTAFRYLDTQIIIIDTSFQVYMPYLYVFCVKAFTALPVVFSYQANILFWNSRRGRIPEIRRYTFLSTNVGVIRLTW